MGKGSDKHGSSSRHGSSKHSKRGPLKDGDVYMNGNEEWVFDGKYQSWFCNYQDMQGSQCCSGLSML